MPTYVKDGGAALEAASQRDSVFKTLFEEDTDASTSEDVLAPTGDEPFDLPTDQEKYEIDDIAENAAAPEDPPGMSGGTPAGPPTPDTNATQAVDLQNLGSNLGGEEPPVVAPATTEAAVDSAVEQPPAAEEQSIRRLLRKAT
eukprot:scaffold285_cov304-Pinguiococcus_pyrenoidosus.AAC.9